MKCLTCGDELFTNAVHCCRGAFPLYPPPVSHAEIVPPLQAFWPQDPKAAELARIRDAIDCACRVVTALAADIGSYPLSRHWHRETREAWNRVSQVSYDETERLIELLAREHALAAEAKAGIEGSG